MCKRKAGTEVPAVREEMPRKGCGELPVTAPHSGKGSAGIHAAASDDCDFGRAMPSGHSTPSGQFSENQRKAFSKFPVVTSPPAASRAKVFPSPKMRVEMPDSDGPPSRPRVPVATAYTVATKMS